MPKIGAHVSAAGGLFNCFANAKKIGAECLQIFGSAPQQWKTIVPSLEMVAKFKLEQKKTKIKSVFLHASYLINLASPIDKLHYGSISHLADELKIAEVLKAQGLVFHLGSAKGSTKEEGTKRLIVGIKETLKKTPGKALLIMENSAGGGDKIGTSLEEIGAIYQAVNSLRLKICLDTAHGFEAGMFEKFSLTELTAFVKKADKLFGWKNVVALHTNDSQTKFNSHHDRHANIGEGCIGLTAFNNLANHAKFNRLPWILEVPGFDNHGPDKRNVDILRGLLTKSL